MRKRNLSEFMCIEMLYDYKLGRLDPLRHQAVEEGLRASPRVKEEFKKLSFGISYAEKLKMITVSEPLVDKILSSPKPSEKFFSKLRWSELPQPVRWASEAVVIAIAIALFITQVPDLFRGSRIDTEALVVKKFDVKPDETISNEVAAIAVVTEEAEVIGTEKQPPVAPVLEETKTVAINKAPEKIVEDVKEKESKVIPKGNAYVYRGIIYIGNVDKVTPEIVALIKNLGGEKAGEVELGWRRKGGSYFHFSLPIKNTATFELELKKLAPTFNWVKSSHPRVMPADTERFIIWVEDNAAAKETTPAGETAIPAPTSTEQAEPETPTSN